MHEIQHSLPFITNDAVVFGLLCFILMLVSQTAKLKSFSLFYKFIPTILLYYFLPSLLTTFGIIAPSWIDIQSALSFFQAQGYDVSTITTLEELKTFAETQGVESQVMRFSGKSSLYFVATRYLLPAALIFLTLGINFNEILKLGPKALLMFLTATVGVMIGGPLAIIIFKYLNPEWLMYDGEFLWKGMTTVAGSWIGGGANQTAMKEIFEVGDKLFSAMVTVDVLIAETWMAFLLLGVGKYKRIDKFFRADASSVESLKAKLSEFSKNNEKILQSDSLLALLGIGFFGVAASYFIADFMVPFFAEHYPALSKFSLTSKFFWLIVISTAIGISLSFTPVRKFEGFGASKIGSVFIYILVAVIGTKMDLMAVFRSPILFAIGGLWMFFHVALLLIVGYFSRSPFFFIAVGSKANIGGAASAPIVAAMFHPSLAPVGVLLAVLGYALGTYAAYITGLIMSFI